MLPLVGESIRVSCNELIVVFEPVNPVTFNFQILETAFFWKKFSDFPEADLIVSKYLIVSKNLTILFYGISAISRYPVLSQAPNIGDATTLFLFFQ